MILIYWIRRTFTKLLAKKHEKFCPECLTKLKESEESIVYHTLDDDVMGRDPKSRKYFYCPNVKCILEGYNATNKPFYDEYGESYGVHRDKWFLKNTRLVSYTETSKNWFFKKGTAAVNSPAAIFDYTVCEKDNFIWKAIEKFDKDKRTLAYNNVTKSNLDKDKFWHELRLEQKKPKYFFLAIIGLFR